MVCQDKYNILKYMCEYHDVKYVKKYLETHDLIAYTKLSNENMLFIINGIKQDKLKNLFVELTREVCHG